MNKVVPRNNSSFFGYGVAQHNRAPKALDPDFVKLDDRSIAELLAYSAELSKYIKYYNLDNKAEGTWEPFFYSDISVIIALIISTDLKSIDDQATSAINDFYRAQSISNKSINFQKLLALCESVTGKFNHWHSTMVEMNLEEKRFESQVEFELYSIIQDKVKPHFYKILGFYDAGIQIKALLPFDEIDFSQYSNIWEKDSFDTENIFFGKSDLEKITAAMLSLRLQYRFLFQALGFTVNHFKRYFQNSLKFKDNHNPDISLFIAFLTTFKNIQNDYGNITERLQAFYYKNILGLDQLHGKSDYCHVFFELAETEDRHLLRKQTKLIAGSADNGQDILFETVNDLEVTRASVEELRTIYCSRLDDLDTSNYKLTSHIYAAPVANSVDGLGKFKEMNEPWPLFGEEQEFKSSEESNMVLADIGWAFSSPVLNLREGNRKVTIRLDFEPQSTRIYKRLVYDIYLKVNKDRKSNEPAKVLSEIFYDRIFNQVDKARNFFIYLSSNIQWYEVNPNSIFVKPVGDGDWVFDTDLPDEENMNILNALEISFTLPNAAPPITGYNPDALTGHKFDTPDPLIRFLLNDKKQPYIYSFLQALEITSIKIDVEVDRVRHIEIYDEVGSRFENKNIYPFGQDANRGANAYLGAPELFKKDLTDVKIHVQWDRIPENVGAFLENYEQYEKPLHPAEIKVQLGAITNYEVELQYDEALEYDLFTTTEGDEEINPVTLLDESTYHLGEEQLALLNILPNYDLPDDNPYTDNVETGFFILELTEPRNAFYSNIYQNEVQQAINKNVQNPTESPKFPKPPVVPFMKSVHLSYKAQAQWNVAHGDTNKPEMIFHIHPYGIETAYSGGSAYKNHLLPKYNDDGYLFIGLKNVSAPETISLFFELTAAESLEQSVKTVPKITWMYLTENRWIPFADSKVIFDTTHGFTESGVVRLQLPITMTDDNTIVDEGLFWIGAKINGNVDKICKAKAIKPNGVLGKWVFDNSLKERLEEGLPPNTINSLLDSTSNIKSVTQPYPSFGQRPSEDIKSFNVRISEQLRHKNRIVTHWDIERIALERFHSILQAKAISYLSNPSDDDNLSKREYIYADEGENEEFFGVSHQEGIKLVVIPKKSEDSNHKTPKYSLYRLTEIHRYLTNLVSPFLNLQVINPKYEYLRVIANIKFVENQNNGQTLNQLFEDINRYIAPWLYSENQEVRVGGSINENVIQNFIKGLPYVKFLTKFSLLHIVEDDGFYKLQDTAMEQDIVSIIQPRPWGVLLPDDIHEIEMVEFEEEELPEPRVNSDQIIRFQNKVNILGDKKYIKVKNLRYENPEEDQSKNDQTNNFTISI